MNTGSTKHDELVKFVCLFEELESSRDLIKSGFGHLQEIDMGNTFYHLPHQLMASGLERFMKCYVLLIHDGRHGSYPVPTENLVPPLCTLGIIEDLASAC